MASCCMRMPILTGKTHLQSPRAYCKCPLSTVVQVEAEIGEVRDEMGSSVSVAAEVVGDIAGHVIHFAFFLFLNTTAGAVGASSSVLTTVSAAFASASSAVGIS